MEQTVKIAVQIDRAEAIRQGRAQYGRVIVEINPGELTQAERELLATSPENGGVFDPLNEYAGGDYRPVIGNIDDPLAVVRDILAGRAKWAVMDAEKTAREKLENERRQAEYRAEYVEKCADPEQWLGTHRMGRRPEVDDPDHSGFFSTDQAKIVRELPSSQSARAEAEKIVAQQIADKIAYYTRRCAEAENWIDLDGEIVRVDGDWLTRQEEDMVIALPESKMARSAAEKIVADKTAEILAAVDRRKNQIDSWVAEHGTENQRGRHALGMLPEDEVIDALRSEAYTPLNEFPRYEKMEADDVRHDDCDGKIEFSVDDATEISAEQWDMMTKIRALISTDTLMLTARKHIGVCSECEAENYRYSLRVAITVGELNFTREYAL
jgi:hypothetical protein